ncbi:uracil-DNA glycosylase [Oscillatoria sp. FACHB-1406]|uniref:uracil-DNA glycosylase n=1 Tax=Oscillatoria sp. FACHB-1406 TaxID=2692846 RepID=UPI00168792D0|nr:uracil-DNA glycosylase [Oscillatoria sp. FACHB-1406]MBD2576250.1 uracil-DNA glycosylase [Oscillatoria sp. FACHB-1406]
MTEEKQLSLFESADSEPASPKAPTNFEAIPTSASVPIPPGTYANLEQLIPHCQGCQRCQLGRTRINTVISRGNPQADIMIIGEGPGQQEDETGLPFVGKSGQLLEKILASVELTVENDIYIANMVKCRPPGNRTPEAAEIEACKPYLLEQIRLVDPKIILFAGATALKGLTGDKRGITKVRGQWLEWDNRLCMAIFHPAYLLRNPSAEKGSPKWLMWQDIREIRSRCDELRAS